MRVALFTETFLPKVDGIVTRLRHTIDHLQRQGHQVLVFCPDGGVREHCGAEVYGVPAFPLPLYPEVKIALARPAINNALKKFRPDLIHVVNPAVLGVGGILFAKAMGLPLVASYHTHLPKYLPHYKLAHLEGLLWFLLRLGHNQAVLNLCTSSAMVEELAAHGIEHTDLWQRGVDTETFHPREADPMMRDQLTQGHPQAPLLIYVGRLGAEKDIERIKPILAAVPGARLAIVGDGPYREALQEIFADTPTNFVGYLAGRELASAYAVADAFVFPSRSETLGLVLLEAMAAGCPVVAAKAGGIPDIVTDGVNGYLFDPLDEGDAIAMTQKLLADPAGRLAMGEWARSEAERWSWGAATEQLVDYYQAVLERGTHEKKTAW
jgi:glycosyltransferase involved in cell wall biosynthesis